MELRVDNVRNADILKWLVDNREIYDFKISGNDQTEKKMRGNHQVLEGVVAEEDVDKTTQIHKANNRDIPKDIGLLKVTEGKSKFEIKTKSQFVDLMEDSTYLLGNDIALSECYAKDGYLLFRGLLASEEVIAAKESVFTMMKEMKAVTDNGTALMDHGWTVETNNGTTIAGKEDFARTDYKLEQLGSSPQVKAVLENTALKAVLSLLASGNSKRSKVKSVPLCFNPNYTWMRIKAPGEFTTQHADYFYFKHYTTMFSSSGLYDGVHEPPMELLEDLLADPPVDNIVCSNCKRDEREDFILICDECMCGYHYDTCLKTNLDSVPKGQWFCDNCSERPILGTCWVPIGNVSAEQGVLAVLPGSQHLPNFDVPLKGSQLPLSYYSKKNYLSGLTWRTGSFNAGDVVFFDSRLIHCSSKNYQDTYRLSVDFRWFVTHRLQIVLDSFLFSSRRLVVTAVDCNI